MYENILREITCFLLYLHSIKTRINTVLNPVVVEMIINVEMLNCTNS